MAKEPQSRFVFPDEDAWAELRRDLKLTDTQAVALRLTLQEAESLCSYFTNVLVKTEVRKSLVTLNRLLSNAHRGLQRADISQALRKFDMHGALSTLLSREAGTELHGKGDVDKLSHHRLLVDLNPEVMSYIIDEMRRPIAQWLAVSAKGKAGRQPKYDRRALLFLLARDASKINGSKPSSTSDGPFHRLCAWVLPACGIDSVGLEDAIERCLEKYREWLEWAQLPSGQHIVGSLKDEDIAAIPDDPEADLTC